MLVSTRMTRESVTVAPEDILIQTPGHYLRLRSGDTDAIVKALRQKGFDVLGVYPTG